MIDPADNAPVQDDLPSGQAPPEPESTGPETEAEREREIQRHLSQQGRELADARRQVAAANAAAAAQANKIGELEAGIRLLSENLTQRDQREAQARAQQIEAELASLPPADRLERKIELLQGQITDLRTAAPQAQPAQRQPAPAPQRQATDQERSAYMEQRVREILGEAQQTFGVAPSVQDIPDADWESEETFYKSVMKQAALTARNGGPVAQKKQDAETPAQMRERIRQEERERLGVTSPTAPRSAPANKRKAATDSDVRAAAQTYDSRLGPKANIKKLQELRESMGH
jgi:hypothetical protein